MLYEAAQGEGGDAPLGAVCVECIVPPDSDRYTVRVPLERVSALFGIPARALRPTVGSVAAGEHAHVWRALAAAVGLVDGPEPAREPRAAGSGAGARPAGARRKKAPPGARARGRRAAASAAAPTTRARAESPDSV